MSFDVEDGIAQGPMDVLTELLAAARRALPHNPDIAQRLISRATELLARKPSPAEVPRDFVSGGLAPWQMTRLRSLIDTQITERLSIARLAEAARLSPSHFARAFARSFGCSPHSFIVRRRVERAKTLMMTSTESLAGVALACGFADQAHFSRLFRKVVGEAPFAWRRAHAVAMPLVV